MVFNDCNDRSFYWWGSIFKNYRHDAGKYYYYPHSLFIMDSGNWRKKIITLLVVTVAMVGIITHTAHAVSVLEYGKSAWEWGKLFVQNIRHASTSQSAFVFGSVVENTPFIKDGTNVILRTITDKVGIGEESPGATLEIQNTAATTKGLIVQGAASQSANLQEWQNNEGGRLGVVSATGDFIIGPSSYAYGELRVADDGPVLFTLENTAGSGNTEWRFKNTVQETSVGTAITTAAAFEIYDRTRSKLRFLIDTTSGKVGIGVDATPDAQLAVDSQNSSNIGIIVQGATSQSANLQEWQNSDGTALASMSASGIFYTQYIHQAAGGVIRGASNNAILYLQDRNFTSGIPMVRMATGTFSNTAGSSQAVTISPTYNQTSGTSANTDLLINRTETAVGSGVQRIIDAQVGGVSKFSISNTGDTISTGILRSNTGFNINGTDGLSATINVMGSDGVTPCSITVVGGIITATTCP